MLLKGNSHPMPVHHFGRHANEDLAQCALFDDSDESVKLTGTEYAISEALFDQLSTEEKKNAGPHNYEILSGSLVVPNIPSPAEHRLMAGKINSDGKTWHARSVNRQPDKLPLGDPELAWSLNHDGEADSALLHFGP